MHQHHNHSNEPLFIMQTQKTNKKKMSFLIFIYFQLEYQTDAFSNKFQTVAKNVYIFKWELEEILSITFPFFVFFFRRISELLTCKNYFPVIREKCILYAHVLGTYMSPKNQGMKPVFSYSSFFSVGFPLFSLKKYSTGESVHGNGYYLKKEKIISVNQVFL